MTRILLDENLPVKLKYRYQEISPEFQVSTVTGKKWTGFKNGELLEKAQKEFDVFVTLDQNLSYQQNFSKYAITIVVLKAVSNRYKDLLEFVEPACQVIKNFKGEKFYEINLSKR